MRQTVDALKALYVALGGNADDVKEINLIPDMINAIAGFVGVGDTVVMPCKGSDEYYGAKVNTLQKEMAVSDGAITGTLKFVSGGLSPSGYLSGDGNFMALKFENAGSDKIEVGLVPSQGSGMVTLDEDGVAVFKVAGVYQEQQQVLKVVTTENGVSKTQTFDISELTLEES